MEALVGRALARCSKAGEVRLLDELKRLSVEAVAENVMSLPAGPKLDRMLGWYDTTGSAFTSLPIPLPGSAYSRGRRAVDQILGLFEEVVREHRAHPSEDGLSRILRYETTAGTAITDDAAKRELHHLVIAGRVVYAHLVGMVLHLTAMPEVRTRLAGEVSKVLGAGPLTAEKLTELSYLPRVLMEVKRLAPVIPGMFGKAKEDLELLGHRIPKGWMLMFALHEMHLQGDVYPAPKQFDPERFSEGRAEHAKHAFAFCPHAPGKPKTTHHCAGTDYATLLATVFTALLVRDYDWELPPQDLGYDYSLLTPDPKDGLRAKIHARTG
jgi:cytochrome P450